ncbi:ECF RNA polymerase sigma factor SigK [Streptomyces sp. SBC-4]|nr:ECF RNA polymerase sigma factor SigK [Streptomyces sp. SBC-4]MDV5145076.1 ECF RNA polymerase sigma factor SigK [Streptomyces sp. SBC-4]
MTDDVPGDGHPDLRFDLPALMDKVAQGDREAFTGVFRAISEPVFGMVRRILRDRSMSEEVAQEVLVEVWRTAPRYDPEKGSVLSWALTLAHRRAVDRVRSEEAASAREARVALLDRESAFDHVVEEVEWHQERDAVRRCLRGLSEPQRRSVTLAYYEGMTYREVAAYLAEPLGTVKSRMRQGLMRLRDCLGVTT